MPSVKSSFIALFFLAPLVQSSPVVPTTSPAHTPWRLRSEPDSLLGRHYVVQNHPASDTLVQDSPAHATRSYTLHQVGASGRNARFARYLAERATTNERVQTSGGTVVNDYLSDVGGAPGGVQVTKAGSAEVEEIPTTYHSYNTAVTLVPRPSETAHANLKTANDKTKSKSTAKHGKTA